MCPPTSRPALPGGAGMFEETPQASGLAAGFFFSGSGNQFAAIRIALVRKTGILPRNVSSTLQPRLRPESGAFFLLRSGCFGLGLRVQPLSQAASLQHGGRRFIDGVARCCAVPSARSRAAATTNLARSNQSLALRALFAGAKSCASVNVCMICPPMVGC